MHRLLLSCVHYNCQSKDRRGRNSFCPFVEQEYKKGYTNDIIIIRVDSVKRRSEGKRAGLTQNYLVLLLE
jgi:hypothetical protein